MAYIFIVVGVIFLTVGIWLLNTGATTSEQVVKSAVPVADKLSNTTPTNIEKGLDFEKFVVSRFAKKYFTILSWQGDKFHEGYYAESNKDPDLIIEFNLKEVKEKFAVECKYRSGFINDKLEWCTAKQMEHYKQFEAKENKPVFIVIGVGGLPAAPEEMYVVPLQDLHYNFVTKSYLQRYKRRDTSKQFFYDSNSKKLS